MQKPRKVSAIIKTWAHCFSSTSPSPWWPLLSPFPGSVALWTFPPQLLGVLIPPRHHPHLAWLQPYVFVLHFIYFFCGKWRGACHKNAWRAEETLQVPVFAFYHIGSGDVTQAVLLGRMLFAWLGHLSGPGKVFIILAFPMSYTNTFCGFDFHSPVIDVIEHLFMCFSANHMAFCANNMPILMQLFSPLSSGNLFSYLFRFRVLYCTHDMQMFSLLSFPFSHQSLAKSTGF